MSKGKLFGLYLFLGGLLILIVYGLYQFIQEVSFGGVDALVAIGLGAILLGIIVRIVAILFEQSSDMEKRKQEINKEDFEP